MKTLRKSNGGHLGDLRRLRETSVELARCTERTVALHVLLEAALASCGTTKGLLWLSDETGAGLRLCVSAGFGEEFLQHVGWLPAGEGGCGMALRKRGRVVVEDAGTDPLFGEYQAAVVAGGFVSCHSVPLLAHDGAIVGVLTIHFERRHVPDERECQLMDLYAQMAADFVAKAQATNELKASEERFRLLAGHAPVGIFLADREGGGVYLNEKWCTLAGLSAAQARGDGWQKAVHPEDRDRVIAGWRQAIEDGSAWSAEYRFLRPDGSSRWLQGNAVQLRDVAGKVTGHIGTVVDITESKEAGIAVRESDQRLRIATQSGKVGVWDWEIETGKVTWTESLYAIHGVDPREFDGTVESYMTLVHPEDRVEMAEKIRRALADEEDFRGEFRIVRPDGKSVWVFTHAVVRKEAGVPVRMLGATLDVTDRRMGEEAVRRLASIVESSEDAIISTDLDGLITSWNAGAERLYGHAAREVMGRNIAEVLARGREPEEADILRRIGGGERIEHYETTRWHKNGRAVNVSLTISPVLSAEGRPVGLSTIARDITGRKRQEAERWRQQKLYRAIGESINYGIWVCDATGRNVYASESFLKLVGLTQEECSAFGWSQVLHPDQLESTMAAWKTCVKTGGFWEREHLFKGVDGEWHPVLARGVPIREEDGAVEFWAGINLDIAAFKKTEEALRQGEQQLRLVTDNAIVFLAHFDRDYRLKFVNRPYATRFGRTPEELVGKTIADLVGAAAFDALKSQIDTALAGRRAEFEMEVPYERFGKRWMRLIHEPERNGGGEVIGVVAVITDITARRQAEREMETARDRAEAASRAKDDFLAALSHELRTPLNPVLLLASEAAGDASLPEHVRADFRTIQRNVEMEARLIDDLLDVTRITRGKLSLNLAVQDAHVILQDAIATMRAELEQKQLTLSFDLQATQTVVWGDSVRLQQVLWNVLKNAVKFTPAEGKVFVRTRDAADGERVIIEIRDTGIGMSQHELARVFDAFSQGDHAGAGGSHRFGGVGLGLAISRMLVGMHRGTIEAASEGQGRGAMFTIELPIITREQTEQHRPGNATPGTGGPFQSRTAAVETRPRLLLVEDHEPTRAALGQLLVRRGFEVALAANIGEARAIAVTGKIDLVISDIGLPDGNGYELMAELRAGHGLSGIALTGYGMDHDVVRSQAAGFLVHLTKPITVQALDQALRAVMPTKGA